ncbi:divalent metal cation transporter [soil metagenome]
MKKSATPVSSKSPVFGKLSGAAFLMATSAIGPGFITQTAVFTQQLFTSFGFVILVSIVLDIIVQMNIWRMIGATRLPAASLANKVFPGLGMVLVVLVSAGGLLFNIGNIGGCGLGLQTLFGIDVKTGAILSAAIAIVIFLYREFGLAMDAFTKMLAVVMLLLTLYTAIQSHPPLLRVLHHSFLPQKISVTAIVTLVGGTVGGYISFAGAHRMLDTTSDAKPDLKQVDKAAISGIVLAGIMRILLFLGAVGVVAGGVKLEAANPTASVFQSAGGITGLKIFGIVLWSAAITSVVGAAYTSVSFLQTLHPFIQKNKRWFIVTFILVSGLIFTVVGNPVNVLVKAGAVNGFILPFSLTLILIAAMKQSIIKDYKHPIWLVISGWLVVFLMTWMSIQVIRNL